MNYADIINALLDYASLLALVMFCLTFAVTIIVQVIKDLFPRLPANFLVVGVAIIVTMLALIVALHVLEITIMWYYAIGALVMGLFVAYAAMYGFDKFKEAWDKLKSLKAQK